MIGRWSHLPTGFVESGFSMTQSRSAGRPSANLSPAQIRAAIPLLEARIADLEALPAEAITSRSDPRVLALQSKTDGTLGRVFGPETNEYHRLREVKFLDAPQSVLLGPRFGGGYRAHGEPVQEIQQGIDKKRQRAVALLTEEVALMKEQLGDDGDNTADRAIRAYSNLDLHPEIARAASGLYRDGHYASAIENAVKALNAWVCYRSGEMLDGTALMEKVFSPKNPVLRFNELKDKSDEDEQRGFMMLFSGAITALRNPRAHKLIEDEAERALEFIAFVSLLAKLLDGATKTL
jgi:uncharacterized protein (TIGR02391 family)